MHNAGRLTGGTPATHPSSHDTSAHGYPVILTLATKCDAKAASQSRLGWTQLPDTRVPSSLTTSPVQRTCAHQHDVTFLRRDHSRTPFGTTNICHRAIVLTRSSSSMRRCPLRMKNSSPHARAHCQRTSPLHLRHLTYARLLQRARAATRTRSATQLRHEERSVRHAFVSGMKNQASKARYRASRQAKSMEIPCPGLRALIRNASSG